MRLILESTSNMLSNTTPVSTKFINRFCEEFTDINKDWLLNGIGTMLKTDEEKNAKIPKPKQLEINFNKLIDINELHAEANVRNSKANEQNAESVKILVDTNTKMAMQIIKLSDDIVKLKNARPAAGKSRAAKKTGGA